MFLLLILIQVNLKYLINSGFLGFLLHYFNYINDTKWITHLNTKRNIFPFFSLYFHNSSISTLYVGLMLYCFLVHSFRIFRNIVNFQYNMLKVSESFYMLSESNYFSMVAFEMFVVVTVFHFIF